jgi:hypothetical protein
MTKNADSGKLPDDASVQTGGTQTEDLSADGTPKPSSNEPERFEGKSREEIMRMYQESESHFNQKLDEERAVSQKKEKDLQAYQSWYSQAQQQSAPQPTQTQQVDQSKLVDALLENPVGTINQILDYRRQHEMYQEAYSEGPSALVRAKKERPDIFEGVDDNQLQQIVFGGIQSGQLHPSLAKKPEAWMMAAGQTKLVQNDFRFQPLPPKPTKPPTGDLPPGVKPQVGDKDEEDDVEFDPLTTEMMEAFGKTKTQVAEQVNKWRKNPDPRMAMTERE